MGSRTRTGILLYLFFDIEQAAFPFLSRQKTKKKGDPKSKKAQFRAVPGEQHRFCHAC